MLLTPYLELSMTARHTNPLKSLLHPYIFVLKEGGEIKNDFLDYSLMMLFIHSTETIYSPLKEEIVFDKAKIKKKYKKPRTL
jgi:hypothetical protein